MALGMGHEKNGVSDDRRTKAWERKDYQDYIRALEIRSTRAESSVKVLRRALREWHEFQCGTGTWEQCEPCQSMIKASGD